MPIRPPTVFEILKEAALGAVGGGQFFENEAEEFIGLSGKEKTLDRDNLHADDTPYNEDGPFHHIALDYGGGDEWNPGQWKETNEALWTDDEPNVIDNAPAWFHMLGEGGY